MANDQEVFNASIGDDSALHLINDSVSLHLNTEDRCLAFITQKRNCAKLRDLLKKMECFDSSKPIKHIDESQVALAVKPQNHVRLDTWLVQTLEYLETSVEEKLVSKVEMISFTGKTTSSTQSFKLKSALKQLLIHNGSEWTNDLERTAPRNWERHGDMIILPQESFCHPSWNDIRGADLWKAVAEALSAKRVAMKNRIKNDAFRSSQVRMLLGNDPFVTHVDNGIKYHFDVTKCMFSAGNISEKLRIASFDCREQIVVDMFAGIGYFTLPYLVHAKAKLVHACEWNTDAVRALEHNLCLNQVRDRCIIHVGNNQEVSPVGIAQHVNLGLIPSSEGSWEASCRAVDPQTGGVLHVHANVESQPLGTPSTQSRDQETARDWRRTEATPKPGNPNRGLKPAWTEYGRYLSRKITDVFNKLGHGPWSVSVLHIEHVKRYAPHVDHIVVDVQCLPPVG